MLKFVRKLRKKEIENEISVLDLQEAENVILRDIQQDIVSSTKFNQVQKSLGLFYDNQKILRCEGRLSHAPLKYAAKFPILLPGCHFVTTLIVTKCHQTVGHNGVKDTLAQLRTKYWLIRGRQIVKKLIKDCTVCKRMEGQRYLNAPVPLLPSIRLQDDFAFSHVGCDFCGPLFVRSIYVDKSSPSCAMHKCWIAIFTCLSSIDLVPDLTVPTFVRCSKRFVHRKGLPYLILSDNGKSFKGQELKEVLLKSGITWRFNISKASWTGGVFERLIPSLKRVLKKLLRNARQNYDELLTYITEVECILNSRPLTYLENSDCSEVLTPSHLCLGKRLLREPQYIEPQGEISVSTRELNRRARYLQTPLSQFWSVWRKLYLCHLREAHTHVARQHKMTGGLIKENDVVLISEEKIPRSVWRIGRVDSLIESKDGHVRAANLRVLSKTGKKPNIIQRPVQKLYPVEANVDLQVKKEVGKKDKMMQNQEVCSNLKNELETEEIKHESSSGRSHLQRKARIEGEIKRQYGQE